MGMERVIKIKTQSIEKEAILKDSPTSRSLWDVLPLESEVNLWGEEIYFSLPVRLKETNEEKVELVEKGDLAYWPPGNALCIFFGPTPISKEGEIKPASGVIVLGKIKERPEDFKVVKEGEKIRVERGK